MNQFEHDVMIKVAEKLEKIAKDFDKVAANPAGILKALPQSSEGIVSKGVAGLKNLVGLGANQQAVTKGGKGLLPKEIPGKPAGKPAGK